ncbi:hypothetical protein CHUAL_008059 [Chamberlinius hualienensis]
MEDLEVYNEAIANRTYNLTVYSTPQLRHNKSFNELRAKPEHRHRKSGGGVVAAVDSNSPGSTTDGLWLNLMTQLRCRTNSSWLFTKFCYCSHISSLSLPAVHTTYHHPPQSHQHIHPKHFPLSYLQKNWFVLIFLLSILSDTCLVMAYPQGSRPGTSSGRSENKHWTNPCNINYEKFNSGEVSTSSQEIDLSVRAEHFYMISKNAEHAMDKANKTKTEFAKETFSDPDFMKQFNWVVYDWLPKIPTTTNHHLDYPELLSKCYEHMQRYAVAIEQMVLDQILYDGNYVDKFREMEHAARTVLCPLQHAILAMKIQIKDVTKEIMSETYRSIDSDSVRNIRDYIILREFIAGLTYIHKEFEHSRKEILKN